MVSNIIIRYIFKNPLSFLLPIGATRSENIHLNCNCGFSFLRFENDT